MEYKNNLFKSLDEIVGLVCQTLSYNLVISYQVDQDRDLCQELMQKYKNACKVFLIEERIDLQSAYNLYSGAYMVFSNRLHVLMLAMLSRALPVGVVRERARHRHIAEPVILEEQDDDDNAMATEDTIKKEIEYCFETRKNEARNLLNAIMWDGKSI